MRQYKQDNATAYWKENLKYLLILLSILSGCFLRGRNPFKQALDSFKLVASHLVSGLHNKVQFMYLSY
jgi:hypothetical protein